MSRGSTGDGLAKDLVTASKGYSHAWRALRHRNFRLYFGGQTISLIGSWMTRIAVSWLVYRMTKSPLALGAIGFAQQAPTLLLSPLAGVVIDRVDRRTLLMVTQGIYMSQSLLLAVLTLTHRITLVEIFAVSIVQGLVGSMDMPLRQSFMALMVTDREDLSNGIAINSSMINSARLIGPSIAGMVIAVSSEGWCFLADGLSYIAVIGSLLAMRMIRTPRQPSGESSFTQLRQGWDYVSGSLPIRSILLLFSVVSLMGYPFVVLMPVFAAQVLGGGPHTLGFLMGGVGVGALVAAFGLAARRSVAGLVVLLPVSALVFGAGLIGFGLSQSFVLSLLLMLVTGYGMVQGIAGANTVLQTLIEDRMRGRVMGYYAMAFAGMAPLGSLLAGALAQAMGAPKAVMVCGVACIAGGAWFALRLQRIRAEIRPIYERLGILPRSEPAVEGAAH